MSAFKRSPMTKLVAFRMTEEEHGILVSEAETRNIAVVDIIREALDLWMENKPAPKSQKRKGASGSAGSKG